MFCPKLWKIRGETLQGDKRLLDILKSIAPEADEVAGLILSYTRPVPKFAGVQLWGLQKAPQYNSLCGIVQDYNKETDRYTIELIKPHRKIRTRGENLLVFSKPADQKKLPPPVNCQVVVIGAGAAGLAAANKLIKKGIKSVIVLEGRDRIGGRIYTHSFYGLGSPPPSEPAKALTKSQKRREARKKKAKQKAQEATAEKDKKESKDHKLVRADLGANYMHKCWAGDDQAVFKLAQQLKIRVGLAAGGRFANTECAGWFDEKTGKPMEPLLIAKCHIRNTRHHARMSKTALQTTDFKTTIHKLLKEAESYVAKRMNHTLTEMEKKIHFKITSRQWGYVSLMEETGMALMRGEKNELAGYEDRDDYGGMEHTRMFAMRMLQHLKENDSPKIHTCTKEFGGGQDRLVVDGYHPFVIDHIMGESKIDIRLNKSVKCVHITDPKGGGLGLRDNEYWNAGPQNFKRSRSIVVSCRDGSRYNCQYVICTVPLGVLQSKSPFSSIEWIPKLSAMKRDCMRVMGMGTHNKVVMRFKAKDVFWPAKTPQLLCPDPRFHFLNLHAYGKTGMMLCHAWPPYADQWGKKSDTQVVNEALVVLRGMFRKVSTSKNHPKPVESVVTRWDSDPFSMGSYSYLGKGATWDHIQMLNLPHPEVGEPRVFFAGEASSAKGYQCVDGAYESGIRAALSACMQYGIVEDK
ncbi:hypothetical protein AAMO2058_000160800 [Amorphochlora amoebiformis]|mmetsp:Transcript_28624/g.45615  ORF Transcript_28624/g.45615 Transcript_28624/m.45615 type:complete len:690 (-) Transcript_28624:161-2230(-)